MALEIERRRTSGMAETDLVSKIKQQRRAWEAELDAQLKRAAIAHAEHLERVIKTQKQIHDVENEQLVQVIVEGSSKNPYLIVFVVVPPPIFVTFFIFRWHWHYSLIVVAIVVTLPILVTCFVLRWLK
ncbi:hypothetical protein niasHT_005479 [Heterodera trifolii]|uniref:Uncharacterized protein n=1 Tax=Heterodera trifolii TaxID=157864 RepID=A0ABD2M5H6_9BILA